MIFQNILEQDKAKSRLISAIKSGRLHHAYLFEGISGIGKYSTAIEFAKSLNCNHCEMGFCNKCTDCNKINRKTHPDITELVPDGSIIKVGQIRNDIIPLLKFKPFEGNFRVIIIRQADKMNINAANALLKSLEEPNENTIFILLCKYKTNLPVTVVSRCQRIPFNPLSDESVIKIVKENLNNKELSDNNLKILSKLSSGSPGRLLEFAEENIMDLRKIVSDYFFSLVDHKDDVEYAIDNAKKFAKFKEQSNYIFMFIISWLKDCIIIKRDSNNSAIINIDSIETISKLSRLFSTLQLIEILEYIIRTETAVVKYANFQLSIESILLKLIKT